MADYELFCGNRIAGCEKEQKIRSPVGFINRLFSVGLYRSLFDCLRIGIKRRGIGSSHKVPILRQLCDRWFFCSQPKIREIFFKASCPTSGIFSTILTVAFPVAT